MNNRNCKSQNAPGSPWRGGGGGGGGGGGDGYEVSI